MAGFHTQSILFVCITVAMQSRSTENILRREEKKKEKQRLKTLKSRQLERAAGSQAACTFKYATLRTGETDDTVTLKKQDDG